MSLPDDLVREIVLKLPSVRSVVRLKCVCKLWRDWITNDHYFVDQLSSRIDNLGNKNEDPFVVFCKHKSNGYYQTRTSTQTSQVFGRINIPFDAFGMVGSCNGLVCLRQPGPRKRDYNLHLYNPITRRYRTLPFSIEPHCLWHRYHGFGFDTSSNDYKVVSIHGRNNVEIYRLSTDRWSRLSNVDLQFDVKYDSMSTTCVYVNGFCYWRLYRRSPWKILAFDFKTETFEHIDFSDKNLGVNYCNDLGVLDDSLALCSLIHPDKSKKTIDTEVWIMSERDNMGKYSWIKKFSIISVDLVRNGGACWVLGSNQAFLLNKGGEVMTFRTEEEEKKGHNAKNDRLDLIAPKIGPWFSNLV